MSQATHDERIVEALTVGELTTDPETGWVHRDSEPVGRVTPTGYVIVSHHSKVLLAHRIVWIAAHGKPEGKAWVVNHRNGRKWDNRLTNLELVTTQQNYHHAAGTLGYYEGVHPSDVAAVDPSWLADVLNAAKRDMTLEQVLALVGREPSSAPNPCVTRVKTNGSFVWDNSTGR